VRQEIPRDLGVVGVVETHGPADHVQFVVSARSDGVGAVFDEQRDDGEIAALGRKMHRVRVAPFITDIRIGAAIEQHSHNGFVADAEMQRRPTSRVAWERSALVDEVRVLVEDRGDPRRVALAGRVEQRGQRCLGLRAAGDRLFLGVGVFRGQVDRL
jgi:hypothetical protein